MGESRIENILEATINGEEYTEPSGSRIETLLIELNELIIEGGGGSSTAYATALSLTIDSSTYVMTAQLLNKDGDPLGTAQTVDLPLESVVVGATYDNTTKSIILTLQSGSTTSVPVGDLVSGLVSTSDLETALATKQDTISDLETIRSNATAGAGADTEVAQARVGADGTSYQTLKARLDHDVDILKDSSLRIDHIMVQGVWILPTPTYGTSNVRLATPENTYLILDYDAYISVASGYQYMIFKYNDEDELVSYDNWSSIPNRLDKKYKYRFNLAKSDSSKISEEEYANLKIYSSNFATAVLTPNISLYGSNYQLEEDDLISKVFKDKDSRTITLGLITDTHYRDHRSARSDYQTMILNNICERVGAKFKVHLGDVIEGAKATRDLNATDLQNYWSKAHKTFVPELYTIAHHELYGSGGAAAYGSDQTALTPTMCIGMYGLTNKYLDVTYSGDKTSWYTDIDDVRFIGLNSVSPTPTDYTDSLSFLQAALASADSKKIVCFAHVTPYKYLNYSNGTTIKGDEVISALSNYSGDILAFFHGHTHWDNIYKPDDNPVYISTCCALAVKIDIDTYGCRDGNPTAYNRVVGQISEYCFDIVNIHPDTGVIKMFRFGAGSDRTYIPAE